MTEELKNAVLAQHEAIIEKLKESLQYFESKGDTERVKQIKEILDKYN